MAASRGSPGLIILTLSIIFLLPVSLRSDDRVQYISRHDPPNFGELLDVELTGDTAFVSAVAGLAIYDMRIPSIPTLVGILRPEIRFGRFYQTAVGNGHAYGASRFEGILIVDLADPTDPVLASQYKVNGVAYEGVTLVDTLLYAAARENGIEIFDASDPDTLIPVGSIDNLEASWRVVVDGPWAYVADGGGGIKVIDVSDPAAPALAGSLSTSSAAVDISLMGDIAYLAVGGSGMDVVDISSPTSPVFLSNFDTPGLTSGVAVRDSLAFLSDWEGIEVVRISDPANPALAGWEDTPIRAMGIGARGLYAFVADWMTFNVYRYGPTDDPDIHLPHTDINLGDVEVGESVDTTAIVSNTGGGLLTVSEISSGNPDFEIEPDSFTITPSDSQILLISFHRNYESSTNTIFTISSDDPDEETRRLTVEITDSNQLQEGELAPDFTLNDLGGVPHTLSDYQGQVVVLPFFTSW